MSRRTNIKRYKHILSTDDFQDKMNVTSFSPPASNYFKSLPDKLILPIWFSSHPRGNSGVEWGSWQLMLVRNLSQHRLASSDILLRCIKYFLNTQKQQIIILDDIFHNTPVITLVKCHLFFYLLFYLFHLTHDIQCLIARSWTHSSVWPVQLNFIVFFIHSLCGISWNHKFATREAQKEICMKGHSNKHGIQNTH